MQLVVALFRGGGLMQEMRAFEGMEFSKFLWLHSRVTELQKELKDKPEGA